MAKTNKYNNIPAHLEDDVLIAYLDGELTEEEKIQTSRHLENCWSCRGELKVIQDSIDNFMSQRQEILIPRDLPPSELALELFQQRLQNYQTQSGLVSTNWIANFFNSLRTSTVFSSPIYLRVATVSLAVIVIAALLLNQSGVQVVSASELLKNTSEAQKNAVSKTSNPVVYQKIQVRRSKNNASVESVSWETWKDTVGNNFRDAVEKEGVRQLIVDKFASEPAKVPHILENERPIVLTELAQILQFNRLNPKDPLSAASFSSWRDSLPQKNEVVNKTTAENNEESFELKVTPQGELSNGQIIQADYLVRAQDWTPLKLRLQVKENAETVVFEIVRQTSEVIALNQLPKEIFPKVEVVTVPSPSVSPKESPSPTESPETELAKNENSNTGVPQVVPTQNAPKVQPATAELEVEVLQLLNNAKADLGEEITVKRENGVLCVRGLIETAGRKNEILNALQSVRENPAVKIELETVAEAQARQKNQPSRTPNKVEEYTTDTLDSAAESELVQYFGNEAKAKQFAAQQVRRSSEAMQHAYALRRLARQFSPAELKNLSPEAKAKWLNLVGSHARNFVATSASLSRELGSVFDAPKVSGAANMEVNSIDDLPRAIEKLVSLAAGNDRLIGSALTISANDAQFSALKAVQFWQSLKNAEALAAKIAAIK